MPEECILGVTGHRPDKLGGEYNLVGPYTENIAEQFRIVLKKYKPVKVISGMALGVDTICAIETLSAGINLIAAIPFEGQENNWRPESIEMYKKILSHKLTEKVYVCEPGYESWKMNKRNEWIVNHCDYLFGIWDGTPGGTCNCIKYAVKQSRNIIRVNPLDFFK